MISESSLAIIYNSKMWSANEPSEVGSNSFGEEQGQYYRLEKRTLHSYPEEELSSHMEEYSFNQLQRHRINNKRE